MSLSKEPLYSRLKSHFVVGYRNIMSENYAGNSGTHTPRGKAVDTTNGAGAHNIQLFVMNPDGTVLHCLPGFWNPDDLARELDFARQLDQLYKDPRFNEAQRAKQFETAQLQHFRYHPQEMVDRSRLQSFDMKAEAEKPHSDAVVDRSYLGHEWGHDSYKAFKTTDRLMHERMAKRPFLPYAKFDVGAFADYGTHTYDKHEDSLDEMGHRIAAEEGGVEGKFVPIKNGRAVHRDRARMARQTARPSAPRVYVRNYGQLKRTYGNI